MFTNVSLASLAALLALCGSPVVSAQSAQPEPAESKDHPPADPATVPPAEEVGSTDAKLAFGYLSDPDLRAKDFFDALFTGKIHLNNRFRVELADTTGRDSSTAITNRIRLGYESKPFYGFSGFIEMENVSTFDEGNYFVPATRDGTPSRTVIAEPAGTEVNQAFGRYQTDSLFDSSLTLDIKAGRQRIKLDDDRFIGNVGWRQFEQTYDSVRIQSNLGIDGLSVQYAYVWRVQRIFGPNGPNWDSDSHFINISYKVAPELRVIPFAYLLDFGTDSPLNSVNTFGLRLTGELFKDAEAESDVSFDYELTYAYQSDAGSNPVDFEADFFAAQARVKMSGFGAVTLGYQMLGSDGGTFGFRFPLGTNHKFQGFADQFLVTPAAGLQDFYVTCSIDLPYGVKSAVTYHKFLTDEGGIDLGNEVDLVASKKINKNWSVLVKAAFFDGHNGQPDTSRIWVQTSFVF